MGLATLGIGKLAWVGASAAYQGMRIIIAKTGERIARYQTERLFRRPEGVPKNWMRSSAQKKIGIRYRDPKNIHNEIRIQKGNPNSSNPAQQKDYIRWKKDGNWLNRNGIMSNDPIETHIPVKDFQFKPELFK